MSHKRTHFKSSQQVAIHACEIRYRSGVSPTGKLKALDISRQNSSLLIHRASNLTLKNDSQSMIIYYNCHSNSQTSA